MERGRAFRRAQRERVIAKRRRLLALFGTTRIGNVVYEILLRGERKPFGCNRAQCFMCHYEKLLGLPRSSELHSMEDLSRAANDLREAREDRQYEAEMATVDW